MRIQVNTDNQIEGRESLALEIEEVLAKDLGRYKERITRVEVHLSDLNGDKSGPADKRCVLETRIAGLRPISVSHDAESVGQAVRLASGKMHRSIDNALGKLSERG